MHKADVWPTDYDLSKWGAWEYDTNDQLVAVTTHGSAEEAEVARVTSSAKSVVLTPPGMRLFAPR